MRRGARVRPLAGTGEVRTVLMIFLKGANSKLTRVFRVLLSSGAHAKPSRRLALEATCRGHVGADSLDLIRTLRHGPVQTAGERPSAPNQRFGPIGNARGPSKSA